MVRPKKPISAILGMIVEVDRLVAVPLRAVRHRLLLEEVAGQVAEGLLLVVREAEVHRWSRSRREVDEYGERLAVGLGGAEQQLVGLGPLEVEVGRVLPGHAEAAVQLHGLLGRVHREVGAEGLRHRDRDVRVGVVGGERRGGVAGRGVGLTRPRRTGRPGGA